MSILTVRHVTRYGYSEPVGFGEHRMMLRPRESHDLRLISTSLDISPRPATLRWLHDVFDNSVAIATFDGPAVELTVDSTVTLEHIETSIPDYALEHRARDYPFAYAEDEWPDLRNAVTRRFPDDDMRSWTSRFLSSAGAATTMRLLHHMTRAINDEFTYVRRTEKGVQRPSDTLRLRSGSCRDFAVLMMEAVRSLGFAARFVSGYIFVPGDHRVHGGGATHAWLQVYLPGAGWIDFDPTNSIVGNRNLIRVAVAWDQGSALPLWGTFTGSAQLCHTMSVDVSVVQEAPDVLESTR